MSKKVLSLQRILVLCGQLCLAVKREPGENPEQTTLLCFPQPSCSTITTIVTVKIMMGRRCCNGISQKTCHNALEI